MRPDPPPTLSPPPGAWAGRPSATVALVLGVSALRLAYLAWFCPYALVEDEAHYWEWSRRLDWSYYSKGPGIAWAIAASTRLLGHTEFAVRLPAVLFSALAALLIAGLARDVSRDGRAGFFAAACFQLAPIFQVSSLLMTIDMPYIACWAGACRAAWRALGTRDGRDERGGGGAWIALGASLAIGFLFKYTIVLLVPGLLAYVFLRRRSAAGADSSEAPGRAGRRSPTWIVAGLLVALLGVVPVVIWNAAHGWPTVRHLLGHLGMSGGDVPTGQGAGAGWVYHPAWTLEFVLMQFALVGPVLLLGLLGPLRRRQEGDAGPGRAGREDARRFLLLCAAPIVLFYLGVTVFTNAEGNWAMGAYVTLLASAGWAVAEGMPEYRARVARWLTVTDRPRPRAGVTRRKPETLRQVAWHFALGVGVVVAAVSLRLDWVAAATGAGEALPVGRLTSAPAIAADAHRVATELRAQTGLEPFIIAQHYGRASVLAFYLPGRPSVFCSSSLMVGRRTQYDLWADTDLGDLARLGGRPAVLVGATLAQWAPAFDRVVEHGPLRGEHKADRLTFLGYGYRGF